MSDSELEQPESASSQARIQQLVSELGEVRSDIEGFVSRFLAEMHALRQRWDEQEQRWRETVQNGAPCPGPEDGI